MCSDKRKGFALVTVLLMLVLLLILSLGIIVSSWTGIQRSSAFQDSNVSYINAMTGVNMVVSFFERLNDPPEWATSTGDLGDVLPSFPASLRNDYTLNYQSSQGTYTAGIFRVLSAERIGGVAGDLPQDFEVVVGGYLLEDGNPVNESRIRTRIRIAPEIEFAYFMHDVPSNTFWVSSVPTQTVPTTRFYGRVHSNGSVTTTADGTQSVLNPEDPVFNDWGDLGYASILSVYRGATPKPLTFHGSGIDDWDFSPGLYPYDWDHPENPNKDWYGLVGAADPDSRITFGGFGGSPTEIDLDADYIPFPTLNEDLRTLVYDGDSSTTVPKPPLASDSPERVLIPDASRPEGGIFIYGDSALTFRSGDFVGHDTDGNEVWNTILTVEQPNLKNDKELLIWVIELVRDSEGNITKVTRDFYKNQVLPPNHIQHYEYSGNIGLGGLAIYVDGNIGIAEPSPGTYVGISNFGKKPGDGIAKIETPYIENQIFKGLSGQTYGLLTIAASYDILITGDLTYSGIVVPEDLDDYTNDFFKNLHSLNGLICRNTFVVPEHFLSDAPDVRSREVNAFVFATGLDVSAPDPKTRDRGVFANIVYYTNVGNTKGTKIGFSNGNWDKIIHGQMIAKGAVINYEMGVMTIKQTDQDGMYERYYFDKRLSIIKPKYMPGTNQGSLIFEWVRLSQAT